MQPIATLPVTQWDPSLSSVEKQHAIDALELGQLLFLPQLAFALTTEERALLSPHVLDRKAKNISYHATTDALHGAAATHAQLTALLSRFAQHARTLIEQLFPHYRDTLQQGRTSFRPIQVSNRRQSYRKDDRRLHVDAFPATPNHGRRILRVFSNINPNGESRVWRIGEPFEQVAQQFLPTVPAFNPLLSRCLHWLRLTKSRRSHYDHIMLHLHDNMKKDQRYQQYAQQVELRLPAQSSWIVQTDIVSHAAMSGQYLLEQTFYLPVHAMADPTRSPLKILERLTNQTLI